MNCTGVPTTLVYDWPWGLLSAEAKDDLTVANEDRFTEYENDATQQTGKIVHQGLSAGGTKLEETSYGYNLQGRMSVVTIDADGDGTPETQLSFEYNDNGIRVAQEKRIDDEGDGFADETPERTDYLIDEHNATGYAQALEEWINGTLSKTYTIGHDVLAEAAAASIVRRLLKDGHGSPRMLVDALGIAITDGGMVQVFRFDAYGNAIGFAPALAPTTLLYNSEQFDWRTGLTYLRARYYDPASGRFNRLDPFFGNLKDPQSLHKYLFVHGDPAGRSDPTGLLSLPSLSVAALTVNVAGILFGVAAAGVFLAKGIQISWIQNTYKPFVQETGAELISKERLKTEKKKDENQFRYFVHFVHGGDALSWIPFDIDLTTGPAYYDFGRGLYTFRADKAGVGRAAIWAKQRAGILPTLFVFKIPNGDYDKLEKLQYTSFGPGSQYYNDVNGFRSLNNPGVLPQPGYISGKLGWDLVIGPEAYRPTGSTVWLANPQGQVQYKWETSNAKAKLKLAFLIPVGK